MNMNNIIVSDPNSSTSSQRLQNCWKSHLSPSDWRFVTTVRKSLRSELSRALSTLPDRYPNVTCSLNDVDYRLTTISSKKKRVVTNRLPNAHIHLNVRGTACKRLSNAYSYIASIAHHCTPNMSGMTEAQPPRHNRPTQLKIPKYMPKSIHIVPFF